MAICGNVPNDGGLYIMRIRIAWNTSLLAVETKPFSTNVACTCCCDCSPVPDVSDYLTKAVTVQPLDIPGYENNNIVFYCEPGSDGCVGGWVGTDDEVSVFDPTVRVQDDLNCKSGNIFAGDIPDNQVDCISAVIPNSGGRPGFAKVDAFTDNQTNKYIIFGKFKKTGLAEFTPIPINAGILPPYMAGKSNSFYAEIISSRRSFLAFDPCGDIIWASGVVAGRYAFKYCFAFGQDDEVFLGGPGGVQKFDKEGNLLWESDLGEPGVPYCAAIASEPQSGLVYCLLAIPPGIAEPLYWVSILKTNGRIAAGPFFMGFRFFTKVYPGHIATEPLLQNIFVVRQNTVQSYTFNGALRWDTQYSDFSLGDVRAIVKSPVENAVYVVGENPLTKLSSDSGSLIWTSDDERGSLNSVAIDESTGDIIVGVRFGSPQILRFNTSGNLIEQYGTDGWPGGPGNENPLFVDASDGDITYAYGPGPGGA